MPPARAAIMAARRRAFIAGSGRPILAATVISRLSFENKAERFLSCAPLRCMMFLNLEWPAMARVSLFSLGRWAAPNRPAAPDATQPSFTAVPDTDTISIEPPCPPTQYHITIHPPPSPPFPPPPPQTPANPVDRQTGLWGKRVP